MESEDKNEVDAVQEPCQVADVSNHVHENYELVQATVTDTSCVQDDAQIIEQPARS